MEKASYYNITVSFQDNILLYNTLSDNLISFTKEEYSIIEELLNNLDNFKIEYPLLYEEMQKRGFIVNKKFNELTYIKLQNRRTIFFFFSFHVIINPTLDCNLKCWYCSTEYAKSMHSGRMNDDTVLMVKKHLWNILNENRAKKLHLDWFGGEPLLYFDEVIYPISSYVKENLATNIIYTQHITTNATLLNKERIHVMKELGFTSFQIPIDGNEFKHNTIKHYNNKTGTYRQVINNINSICDIMPNAQIILRINYDYQTLKNITDIISDLSENSKNCLFIDFHKVWQIKDREDERKQLKEIKNIFNNKGFSTMFWAYEPKRFHRCYSDRFNTYAINYDVRIFKCTARDYGNDKVIGTLLDNGDIDWNHELLSE